MSNSFDTATRAGGMKRVVERHPYSGQGIDGLIAQLGILLKAERHAQRVILDVNRDYIHLEKLVKGAQDQDELAARFDAAVRSQQMREHASPKANPYETLFDMFREINDEGLEACFVIAGDLVRLSKWVRVSPKNPKLFGVRVQQVKTIPSDVFLICGAEYRDVEPEDIAFSVKGVLP